MTIFSCYSCGRTRDEYEIETGKLECPVCGSNVMRGTMISAFQLFLRGELARVLYHVFKFRRLRNESAK